MKNVFITGSGRSGTSMLAGAFRLTPAYLGDRLYPAGPSNPKGFFEDANVNQINEAIITDEIAILAGEEDVEGIREALPQGQLWLASIPNVLPPTRSRELQKLIAAQTAREPFCFKDPRFSATLCSWLPYAGDCVVLVIFRDPATTVESILKECRTAPYLRDLALSVDDAMTLWWQCYCRLLDLRLTYPNICFVHYDRVLDGSAISVIEALVGCELDRSFPVSELSRVKPSMPPDELCTVVYKTLQEVAEDDLGTDLILERRRIITKLAQGSAVSQRAHENGTRKIVGTYGFMHRVAAIRERQRHEEIAKLRTEADASRQKLQVICSRLQTFQTENFRLRQELTYKRTSLDQLIGMADTISHLKHELEQTRELQRQFAVAEQQANERCATALAAADARSQELAHLNDVAATRHAAIEKLAAERQEVQERVEALMAEINIITQDLEEAKRAKIKMKRSLSWRITKPLRAFDKIISISGK